MNKLKRKVVVVGEPSVGKTSLLSAQCNVGNFFPKDYIAVRFFTFFFNST